MSSPRSAFLAGVRAEMPIIAGVIPFGLIYGAAAWSAGLPSAAAVAMSSIVFAGSSQYVFTRLFASGTLELLIIATVFTLNLRHLLYSAALAPRFTHLRRGWKWLLAYLLTDEAFAVTAAHFDRHDESLHGHWFFLGAGTALWATWQSCTLAGVLLGQQAGRLGAHARGLEFAIVVTFIALVVPGVRRWAQAAAAVTAGAVALAAHAIPYNLGLLIAAAAGVAAGMAVERATR